MVNIKRLKKLNDYLKKNFKEFSFPNKSFVLTKEKKVLLVDPIYIADVYNATDEASEYVRLNGLIFADIGGDVSGPVWWKPPFLKIPISMHYSKTSSEAHKNVKILCDRIGTDSGSFVFLPLKDDLPDAIQKEMNSLIADNNAVILELPAGKWTGFHEQFKEPQRNMRAMYRNIVLKHTLEE